MKNFILSLLFLIPCCLMAQVVTVSESISIKDDASYDLIPDAHGNILLFRNQTTKFEVQGFDGNLRQQWEKELELDKKRPEIVKVIPMGDDFCVLYVFRDKGHPVLKVHRYNPAANLVDSVTIKRFDDKFFFPKFEVEISEDKKVALLYNVEQDKEFNVISFHLGQMKLLWEKKFSPSDMLFFRDFQQMLVGNNGDMHLILSKDNTRSKSTKHSFEIMEYSGGEETSVSRYIIPMQGYLTYDVQFAVDNLNQALIAGGLYATDNISRTEGFYYLHIPQTDRDKSVLQFHPFEVGFVNILQEKEKSKNKGIPEASVQEIVLRRDGGIILIGELNKMFQRGGTTAGTYSRSSLRSIIDYYYDDIFLISLHPNGEQHWKNILHKKQYSQDDNAVYSSYFLAKTPTAIRVIFNDEVKPENTVSEYVIIGNGEFDRNAVMNTERQDLSIRFRDGVQVSATAFVAPSERRGKLKLVKVVY